jgi:alpha-L-fucosidase
MTGRLFLIAAAPITLVMAWLGVCYADKPIIKKRGTIECDLVETTPVAFQNKLYRFEYVRENYKANPLGAPCFRFVNVRTGESTKPFAAGYHLGSAFVENNRMHVYGVEQWGADTIRVFWSDDLKTWTHLTALHLPGWGIYNTSVCKDDQGYTMAIEIGEPPEVAGERFTIYFARSEDLLSWELAPTECVYSKEKYTACPTLRFYDGWYYMVYLEHHRPKWYFAPHIVRSRDLVHWQQSRVGPLMEPSAEDKQIANPNLTPEERERIAKAVDCNNSDLDFCEFDGRTLIYYTWGNQRGTEFLAEAVYEGSEEALLKAYFLMNATWSREK